jgi:hypothetical protein
MLRDVGDIDHVIYDTWRRRSVYFKLVVSADNFTYFGDYPLLRGTDRLQDSNNWQKECP